MAVSLITKEVIKGVLSYPLRVCHANDAVASVIKKAKHEVLICTGSLAHQCYESPEVLASIRAAQARNPEVVFAVLTGPNIDKGSKEAIGLLCKNIYILNKAPRVHFTLADSRHFRLETKDPIIQDEYKNELVFNDQLNGNYLRRKFTEALLRAKKYQGDNS